MSACAQVITDTFVQLQACADSAGSVEKLYRQYTYSNLHVSWDQPNIFILNLTIGYVFLKGGIFVSLPSWIIEIFIEHNYCSRNDLFIQIAKNRLCRGIKVTIYM